MICGAGKQIADRWVKEVKKKLNSQKISGRRVLENTAALLTDENARRS